MEPGTGLPDDPGVRPGKAPFGGGAAESETSAVLSLEILEAGQLLFGKQQGMDFQKKYGKAGADHPAGGTLAEISG